MDIIRPIIKGLLFLCVAIAIFVGIALTVGWIDSIWGSGDYIPLPFKIIAVLCDLVFLFVLGKWVGE